MSRSLAWRKDAFNIPRCAVLGLFLAGVVIAPGGEAEAQSPAKQLKTAVAPPKLGVKTPGVLIPYTKLKSENDFQIDSPNASWMLVSDSLVIPDVAKKQLTRIDPKTDKLIDPISGVDQPCAGAVEAFKSLWVPDCKDQTVARINAKTGKIEAKLATGVGHVQFAVTSTADSIWVLTDEKTTLARIDPATNEIVAALRLPAGCNALRSIEGALWVTCPKEDLVLRIDPTKNVVNRRIRISGEPWALANGEGSIWVLLRKIGEVVRIDPNTNQIAKTIDIGVPNVGSSIAVGQGSLWVSSPGVPITRIDLETEQVVQQFSGDGGGVIQVGFGSVWLVNRNQNTISRIDPKRIIGTLAD